MDYLQQDKQSFHLLMHNLATKANWKTASVTDVKNTAGVLYSFVRRNETNNSSSIGIRASTARVCVY